MSARTIALAAAAVVAVVLALAASGVFDRGSNAGHKAAVRYVAEVNAIQRAHARQSTIARIALERFGKGKSHAGDARRLRAAAASFEAARRETDALRVPHGMEKVHRDVGDLLAGERNSLLEIARMIEYPRRIAASLRAAGRADAVFHRRLRHAKTPKAQLLALDAYAAAVSGSLHALRRVVPPPLFSPWHRSQVGHLRAALRFARDVSLSIHAKDAAAVQRSLRRYQLALADTVSLSRAQRRAVIAYNRRLTALASAAGRIQADEREAATQIG